MIIWEYISSIAYILKIVSPLFKAVNYGQQFFVISIIPNFRPLEFSVVEYYWSLVELGSV